MMCRKAMITVTFLVICLGGFAFAVAGADKLTKKSSLTVFDANGKQVGEVINMDSLNINNPVVALEKDLSKH